MHEAPAHPPSHPPTHLPARVAASLLNSSAHSFPHCLQLKRGDGRVLSYCGQAAAAAAKVGRPLDLRGISARIDAGGWL